MSAPATVLLLSPGALRASDRDVGLPHLVALGSYLQRELPVRVEIVDLGFEGGELGALASALDRLPTPRLCGVCCYSSYDALRSLALGRWLRDRYPGVPLVVGGYHPSAQPEAFRGAFDHVVVGEGERPLAALTRGVLDGPPLEELVLGPEPVEEIDSLPPYDWSLLHRYLPRLEQVASKFQIYLSRGCPYSCSFCMERCKAARRWRPFSPERALDELERLGRAINLRAWVLNVADPLFGLRPDWRREVLEGIVARGLTPRQFWTLTRVDALENEDVELLRRARFGVGVGLESGSPRMLEVMRKSDRPARYLEGIQRFAGHARRHLLPWAANLILGHPGEDEASIRETVDYVRGLFPSGQPSSGWLSVDPFRLYPGSEVFEQMEVYHSRFGTAFPFPRWWESAGDRSLSSELVDPSAELCVEDRIKLMHRHFADLVTGIRDRFVYTGRSIDLVFERSLAEQVDLLAPRRRRETLLGVARLRGQVGAPGRAPESLEAGVLSEELRSALARLAPRLPAARTLLALGLAGDSPPFCLRAIAHLALEPGECALLVARDGLGAAVARELVGDRGAVVLALEAGAPLHRVRGQLRRTHSRGLRVRRYRGARGKERFDAILLEGCVPALPRALCSLLVDGGRLLAAIGPRFRSQELTIVLRRGEELERYALGPVRIPPLRGEEGWLR